MDQWSSPPVYSGLLSAARPEWIEINSVNFSIGLLFVHLFSSNLCYVRPPLQLKLKHCSSVWPRGAKSLQHRRSSESNSEAMKDNYPSQSHWVYSTSICSKHTLIAGAIKQSELQFGPKTSCGTCWKVQQLCPNQTESPFTQQRSRVETT